MRYFLFSLLAVLLVSAVFGCEGKPEGQVVIKVNERAITLDEFQQELKRSEAMDPEFSGSPDEMKDLAEELVTRELLIQEAMRQGLDSEENFRRRIRKYFEQTLIEELMRAEARGMTIEVSDDEIQKRYELMGKVFRMDVASVDTPGNPGACLRADEALWNKITGAECRYCHELIVDKDMEVMLEYLPVEFSNAVNSLGLGEVSGPVLLQGKFCYVKLKGVEDLTLPPLSQVREQIKESLVKEKQAGKMEQWLRALREDAQVKIDLDAMEE